MNTKTPEARLTQIEERMTILEARHLEHHDYLKRIAEALTHVGDSLTMVQKHLQEQNNPPEED